VVFVKRSIGSSQPATKLSHHIRELQIRLFVSIIALCLAGVVVYNFYEPILTLLRSPLDAPLYYSSPAGSFSFIMKICLMGSLAITIPVLVYNLIMFVRPAFEKFITRKRVYVTSASSAILAIAGAAFGFVFIIPGSLHFFAGFQVEGLSALISADSYLSLVTNVIITFMFVFQLPLLIAFIDSVKPLTPKSLLKMNKWVILGSLVVSLLVPFAFDLMTSLMIAAPIVVLYNLSIAVVALQHAHSARVTRAIARASNVRQIESLASTPVSNLSLDDQLVASFTDELSHPHESLPVLPATTSRRTSMDVRILHSRPSPVVSRNQVAASQPQISPLGTHVRVISDMVRAPRSNRALASQ